MRDAATPLGMTSLARSYGFEPLRRQSFLEHCALDLAYSTFDDTQFFRFTLLASSMHVRFCLYVYQITAAWFCGARSFCCDCLGWAISYSGRRERCKRASDKGCRYSDRNERWQQAIQNGQDGCEWALHFRWSADRHLPGHVGCEWRHQSFDQQ